MGKKSLFRINVLLLLLIIVSLFCSCTNEMNMLDGNNNKQINFSISVPEWKNTDSLSSSKTSRATPITDASLSTSNTFNLIADQNDGAGNYSILINKEAVSFTNNIWQTTPSHYYWSGIANKTVNFYAYYPISIFNLIPHSSAGSTPAFSYTIPDNVTNQIDIITATSTNVPGNTVVPTSLIFKHIFAAIQFSVGSGGIGSGTISSISIANVANSGTYTFGSGWSNVIGSKTFTISQPKAITGASGEDIYSGTYSLMMIPQAINNVIITITYSNGGTLTKVISGSWEAGNIYNYKLSYPPRTFDYTGEVQTYTVPVTGIYNLEVWGAQGGYAIDATKACGGYGGMAFGRKYLVKGNCLYIVVGGQGGSVFNHSQTGTGGYNGGGKAIGDGATGWGGGGGATHISTVTGLLSTLSSQISQILIIGGGGGGGGYFDYTGHYPHFGGDGGGINGNAGSSEANDGGSGGAQMSGFAFGLGQDGKNSGYGSGGGGGYYGGYSGYTYGSAAGGGSGYLGIGLISGSTGMSNGVRSGNGHAKITFVSAN